MEANLSRRVCVSIGLVFGLGLGVSQGAIAQDFSSTSASPRSESSALDDHRPQPTPALESVPLVYQFAAIQPTDWEYQQLRQLIENYGIDLTTLSPAIEEGRSLSRYEFAVVLQNALSQIERRLQDNNIRYINRRDFQIRAQLTEQFQVELESLDERLTDHEQRVFDLEVNRVSPLARLNGEAVLAIAGQAGGDLESSAVFQHRLRLDLTTRFTGRDQFLMRLSSGGTPTLGRVASDDLDRTAEGTLASAIRGDTGNDIALETLSYTFPVGDRLSMYVSAVGGLHGYYVQDTFSPYFEDYTGGNGSISAFSQSSPIYSIGGGAGLGLNLFLDEQGAIALSAGYFAESAALSPAGEGLFNGDSALLGQVSYAPSDRLQLGATYVRGVHTSGNAIFDYADSDVFQVGTAFANGTHTALDATATTNSYGLQVAYRASPRMTLHAFGGYTDLDIRDRARGDIWYYGIGAGLPDLLLPNSLAGVAIGAEPYLGGMEGLSSELSQSLSNDTSLHVEIFYRL
ncbi:MAG: iron uptake porin, partial [Elainellaceae cyanobacterium]